MVDHVILVQGYSCLSEELYIDKTSCTQLSDLASIPHTQVECLTDSPHQGMPGHIREEQNHFGEAPTQRAALLFWASAGYHRPPLPVQLIPKDSPMVTDAFSSEKILPLSWPSLASSLNPKGIGGALCLGDFL